jgi:hypothetical protein
MLSGVLGFPLQPIDGHNPVNGKNLDDLYHHTQDKIQYIKEQGYNVVEMWECQWLASIKRDPELSRFIEHRKRPCDGLITIACGHQYRLWILRRFKKLGASRQTWTS